MSERIEASFPRTHLPWIDWLRFLAAFLVLCEHVRGAAFVSFGDLPAAQQTPIVTGAFLITRLSHEASLLFFVLSGFLVGGKLIDRIVNGTFDGLEYSLDRVTRIYIPLIPALILSGIVATVTNGPNEMKLFVANALGFQVSFCDVYYGGNLPLWTLGFEIWFYAFSGSLACLIHSRRLSFAPLLVLIVGMAVFTRSGSSLFFCWIIGAIGWRTRPSRGSLLSVGTAILLIIAGIIGYQLSRESSSANLTGLRTWLPSQSLFRLLPAVGFALVLQNAILWHPKTKWLEKLERIGTPIAACSYTLYLIHYPLLLLLGYLGWPRAKQIDFTSCAAFTGLLMLCFAVSLLFFWAFESRTTSVRKYLRGRLLKNTRSA